VAALREQLRSGDKSLVGNKGDHRYRSGSDSAHFRIDAAKVADLLELSGVSRSAFYEHFRDKEECLLGALGDFVAPAIGSVVGEASDAPPSEERIRGAFEKFMRMIVEQAPAARLCFVEIYAAGPRAVDQIDRTTDAFQAFVAEAVNRMPGRENAPPELVRAVMGGLRKIIHTRLYRGEEEELVDLIPQMWDWAMAYSAPPEPLRRPRGRSLDGSGRGAYDPAERILQALAAVVAEKGYPAMTVGDVAARASISLSTFYANFADKEDAMLAAIDSGSSQMLATTLPAFRRAVDWPHAVHGAFAAMLAFCAAEPAYTRLGAMDVYAAGGRALEQREQVMKGMEMLLAPGYERRPGANPIAAEAIGGAIYATIYERVKRDEIEALQEVGPLATYVALAPFLGAEEACAIANGDARGR